MIRKLKSADFQAILTVVNDAAIAYRGKIPADRWKEPYMPAQELKEEIQSGIQFYGYMENNPLIAVMGIQPVNDVTLIRHAYTLTSHQRKGIGEKLLNHLLPLAKTDGFWWAHGKPRLGQLNFTKSTGLCCFQGKKQINSSRNTGTSLNGKLKPQSYLNLKGNPNENTLPKS